MHFKFLGLARVYSIYRIYVYSVIDPSGTFILGAGLLPIVVFGVLIVFLTGRGLRRNYLELLCSSVLSSSLNLDPEWSFPPDLKDFCLTGFTILWILSCSVKSYFVINKTCWLVFC